MRFLRRFLDVVRPSQEGHANISPVAIWTIVYSIFEGLQGGSDKALTTRGAWKGRAGGHDGNAKLRRKTIIADRYVRRKLHF